MVRCDAIDMWIALSSCTGFFAAMRIAGGGRNELDPRFISKLSIFSVTVPCDETVKHIYRSILAGHAGNFAEEIRTTVTVIVEATLGLYKVRHSTLL
jgi:dynein heavy chain